MKKQIGDGAEAVIYLENDIVIKDRIKKDYRINEIDEKLRKFRTRREAKILEKLESIGFNTPKVKKSDDKLMTLEMEFIKGDKLRDVLNIKNCETYGYEIGKKIAILHNNDVIHQDLTTSNMILDNEIVFIDFGLSFISEKIEDKAVDLHLLRQALESKHHEFWEECFKSVKKGYKENAKQPNEVLKRLEKVEGRGRNKGKH